MANFSFTEENHRDKIAVIYITDTMGLLIGSCVIVTLIVGFAAGYLCSRHFRAVPYSNVSLHPNHQLNRLVNTFPLSRNSLSAANSVSSSVKNKK